MPVPLPPQSTLDPSVQRLMCLMLVPDDQPRIPPNACRDNVKKGLEVLNAIAQKYPDLKKDELLAKTLEFYELVPFCRFEPFYSKADVVRKI